MFQSLNGVALGIEACIAARCDSPQAYLGVALLGGGVGAVVSANLPALTPGQRALLNSGTAWGAVNAGLVLLARDSEDVQTAAGTLIAGQVAGLLAGATLFDCTPPPVRSRSRTRAASGSAW